MADDERFSSFDKRLSALLEVAKNHEERLSTLLELAHNHEDRLDTLVEAQANSDVKIAALADAQIQTQEALRGLTVTVSSLTEKMTELAAAQAHTDRRFDALIDIVRQGRNGKSEN